MPYKIFENHAKLNFSTIYYMRREKIIKTKNHYRKVMHLK